MRTSLFVNTEDKSIATQTTQILLIIKYYKNIKHHSHRIFEQ